MRPAPKFSESGDVGTSPEFFPGESKREDLLWGRRALNPEFLLELGPGLQKNSLGQVFAVRPLLDGLDPFERGLSNVSCAAGLLKCSLHS